MPCRYRRYSLQNTYHSAVTSKAHLFQAWIGEFIPVQFAVYHVGYCPIIPTVVMSSLYFAVTPPPPRSCLSVLKEEGNINHCNESIVRET